MGYRHSPARGASVEGLGLYRQRNAPGFWVSGFGVWSEGNLTERQGFLEGGSGFRVSTGNLVRQPSIENCQLTKDLANVFRKLKSPGGADLLNQEFSTYVCN